jgi:hypothetical protein
MSANIHVFLQIPSTKSAIFYCSCKCKAFKQLSKYSCEKIKLLKNPNKKIMVQEMSFINKPESHESKNDPALAG